LNGVPLWDIDLEMHMVFSEIEFAKLKAKAFQVPKRLHAEVDRDLFSKAMKSVVGDKHHRHLVIASITRTLFRATTTLQYPYFP